jgi:hypothetical protein
LTTKCCGKYMDVEERRKGENGEKYIIRVL